MRQAERGGTRPREFRDEPFADDRARGCHSGSALATGAGTVSEDPLSSGATTAAPHGQRQSTQPAIHPVTVPGGLAKQNPAFHSGCVPAW